MLKAPDPRPLLGSGSSTRAALDHRHVHAAGHLAAV